MVEPCLDAFKCIYIENPNHSVKISPCCHSRTIETDKIEFQNDLYLNKIRDSWRKNEWPTECINCKMEEDEGLVSRRQHTNEWYKSKSFHDIDISLVRMDYWVGDTCNLKCVTCNPDFSSSWKEEMKIPISDRKVRINKFWKNLDLSKLRWIHFNGGEPMLNKEHIELLKAIPNKSLVHVVYNTNTTVLPSEDLINTLLEFESVNFMLSIDDIDDRFEYLRFPAKWELVLKNIEFYKSIRSPTIILMISRVISPLTFKRLTIFDEWVKKTLDNVSTMNLPARGLFDINDIEKNKKKLVDYLNSLDERRGTDWKITFPEVVELLL